MKRALLFYLNHREMIDTIMCFVIIVIIAYRLTGQYMYAKH